MGLIMSKTVLNFEMNPIGQFRVILEFCTVFVGSRQKLPEAKSVNLTNKHRFHRNDISAKYCFAPQNEPHAAIHRFSDVLKNVSQSCQKKQLISVLKDSITERSQQLSGKDFSFLN